MLIPGPVGRFVEIDGQCFCSEAPSGIRTDDQMDMGFVWLGSADQAFFDPRTRPLQEEDIALDVRSLDGPNMYTFVGYPWRKTETQGQDLIAGLERFSGIGQDSRVLERQGLNSAQHIAISFHRGKSTHGGSAENGTVASRNQWWRNLCLVEGPKGYPTNAGRPSTGGYRPHLARSGMPSSRYKN